MQAATLLRATAQYQDGGAGRRLPDARRHEDGPRGQQNLAKSLPSLSLPLRGFNKAAEQSCSRPVTAASAHYEQLHQIQETMRAKAAQEAAVLRTELQIALRRAESAEAQLQRLQQQPLTGQSVAAPPSEKSQLATLQQQLLDATATVEQLRTECADMRREAQLLRKQIVGSRQREATAGREAKAQRTRADAAAEACRQMRCAMAWHRAELLRLRQEVVSLSGAVAEACSACEAAAQRSVATAAAAAATTAATAAATAAGPEEEARAAPVTSRRQVEEQILQRMIAQGLPDRQARLLVGLPLAAGQSRRQPRRPTACEDAPAAG